jgi:peptidoglycan/xylan/chitin deacetylase (PgdA/CDA1 family)
LSGSDERVRAWAAESKIPASEDLPSYAHTATLDELRDAVAVRGITVGSHSWSHANLSSLERRDISAEIVRPRDWLHEQFGAKSIRWLAYPYGLESEQARRAVADASYLGALRIGGGWHRPAEVSAYARPRLSVPSNLSLNGFKARVFGTIPS